MKDVYAHLAFSLPEVTLLCLALESYDPPKSAVFHLTPAGDDLKNSLLDMLNVAWKYLKDKSK